MTSTDLTLWVPVIHFNDRPGVKVHYRAPRDTLDPRYAACHTHHVACDCREALLHERIGELASYRDQADRMEQAIDAVLLLHQQRPDSDRCRTCWDLWPCPTRCLLAPHTWAGRHEDAQ